MKIKALEALTWRDSTTGNQISIAYGTVADIDQTVAEQLISEGLAVSYLDPAPTGTKSITENANNIDVADYAKANVNVPNPSTGTLSVTENGTADVTDYASVSVNVVPVTVTYNANTGTGSVDPVTVGKGTTVELSDGTGLTAPSEKEFGGWATTADAEEANVTSPYKVTADVTLYAVWVAEETTESTD